MGEVTQGERPAAEGKVAAHKLYSAALWELTANSLLILSEV